jgi:TolA-binding protein
MRIKTFFTSSTLLLAVALTAGCASDGNMSNSVYATHRIVRNIEQDIGPNVTKLNETAAELVARVEASDQENKQLRAIIEENQAKIDRLQQQIAQLTSVLYRQMGLTQAPSAGAAAPSQPAQVVPPPAATTTPIATQPGTVSTTPGGSMINQPAVAPPSPAVTPIPPGAGTTVATPPPAVSAEAAEVDYISAQKAFIDESYDEALKLYTAYLTRYPDGASAHNAQFWKAECYRRLGQYENAIREFEYLEQRYGDAPDSGKLPLAMKNRAEAHLALGQTERATEILRDLIEKYPMTGVVDGANSRLRSLEGE